MTRGIDRRRFALGSAGAASPPRRAGGGADDSDVPLDANVLRVLFESAETGFDPAQVSDLYSNRVIAAHLRGAARLRPAGDAGAAGAADGRGDAGGVGRLHASGRCGCSAASASPTTPAFKGRAARARRRRTTCIRSSASSTRRCKSPAYSSLDEDGHPRARRDARRARCATRSRSTTTASPRACARSTATRCSSGSPSRARASRRRSPRARTRRWRARSSTPIASDIMAHPVGTGPYRLKAWRRSSRIVLEKNPGYRDVRYQSEPAPDDVEGQAWAKRFNGRRLPLNDGVEIAVVQENQPRWLSFLNGAGRLRARSARARRRLAAPNGKLAPESRQAGHPPAALPEPRRRDVVLQHGGPGGRRLHAGEGRAAPRDPARLRHRLRDQASSGAARRSRRRRRWRREPTASIRRLRTDNSRYDVARAKALLDIYGYVDRDGDGWREQPDGSPLVLHDGERDRADLSPVQRELAAQHGGDRHPHESSRRRSGAST